MGAETVTFEQVVKLVFEQSAPLAMAVFAMWMLNRTWESRLQEATRYAQEIAEQRRELVDALKGNTEALTRVCQMLKVE
jgi:Na+(H+)/acetate symporter ActP